MNSIAYYNGKFAPAEEMMIPALDRGVYFGDGVYEALYARNRRVFALREHMQRLEASLRLAEIAPPMPPEEIEAVIYEALERVPDEEQIVYFQITRGTYPRMHAYPPEGTKSNLLLFTAPHGLADVGVPVKLRLQPDERWARCDIKTLNLLPNVMAAQRAAAAGCMETVFYRGEMVTECASSNIFILKDEFLRTAPLSNELLAGITRRHTIELAERLGILVLEKAFTVQDLLHADEVLITNTVTHCAFANEIDGKPVGGRAQDMVKRLQQAFREKVAAEVGELAK